MPDQKKHKHKPPTKRGTTGSPQPDPLRGDGVPEPPEREPPRQDGEPVRPTEQKD